MLRNAARLVPLLCALLGNAQAADDCSALQAELTRLRAQVTALEAALRPSPSAAAPASLPGAAAKPAATTTVVIEEPYSRSGCSTGLFKRQAEAKWQDPELWLSLEKGQSPADVEALLGVEHYDIQGGRNVRWEFGKCGPRSEAQALFTDGRLAGWRAPGEAR